MQKTEQKKSDWADPTVVFRPLKDGYKTQFHMLEIIKTKGKDPITVTQYSVHVHTLSKRSLAGYVNQARRYKGGELNFLLFYTPEGEFHFVEAFDKLIGSRAGGIEANERIINCSLDEFISKGEEVGGQLSEHRYVLATDAAPSPALSIR